MKLIENEYKYNKNFRDYVDNYCCKNGITLNEAFADKNIQRVFWVYTEL